MKNMNRAVIHILVVVSLISIPSPIWAKNLEIGLGNFNPYFSPDQESGLFTDIVQEIYRRLPHHEVQYVLNMSNQRLVHELKTGRIDAAANIVDNNGIDILSLPVFKFTDVAITLKKNALKIRSIEDLQDKSVGSYQNAKLFFGDAFKTMATTNPHYEETHNQYALARKLVAGRVQVSIGDLYTFLHTIKQAFGDDIDTAIFEIHDILPQGGVYMGFNDPALRDEFDEVVKAIQADGTYDALYKKYLHKLGWEETLTKE